MTKLVQEMENFTQTKLLSFQWSRTVAKEKKLQKVVREKSKNSQLSRQINRCSANIAYLTFFFNDILKFDCFALQQQNTRNWVSTKSNIIKLKLN